MKLTEGQVWVHRNKEDNQYDKYLMIDYVTNTCFNGRETPFGKVTSFICCNYDYLLNECWELLDAEKICELLRKQSECIRIIHESAEHERQLISKCKFEEQEVKEKERICESVQARLMQTAEELDVEREKRIHVEKRNCELEEKVRKLVETLIDINLENKELQSLVDSLKSDMKGVCEDFLGELFRELANGCEKGEV